MSKWSSHTEFATINCFFLRKIWSSFRGSCRVPSYAKNPESWHYLEQVSPRLLEHGEDWWYPAGSRKARVTWSRSPPPSRYGEEWWYPAVNHNYLEQVSPTFSNMAKSGGILRWTAITCSRSPPTFSNMAKSGGILRWTAKHMLPGAGHPPPFRTLRRVVVSGGEPARTGWCRSLASGRPAPPRSFPRT